MPGGRSCRRTEAGHGRDSGRAAGARRRRRSRPSPPGTRTRAGCPQLADRWDVALIAIVVIPATFLVVWLLAPFAEARRLLLALARGRGGAPCCSSSPGSSRSSTPPKIVAFALFGFWFLQLLEQLWWVVLVAALIPLVDIASVYRGPTKVVVEEEPGVFERIAISFALPGEEAAARLGPPDVIFFALFLAAAGRFGLRRGATWLGMTAAISATLVLTYALELDGLPALPAVSLGFLLPNADLLWRELARPLRDRGSGARLIPRPGPPRIGQQFSRAQASMFSVACCTSGVSSLLESSCSFASASGLGVSPRREVDALERIGELLEVVGEHLVVVPDLLRHLVGDLVEDLCGGVDAARAGERARELCRETGEARALALERRGSVVGRPVVLRGHVVVRIRRLGLDDSRVVTGGRAVAVVAAAARGQQRERRKQQHRKSSCSHVVTASVVVPPASSSLSARTAARVSSDTLSMCGVCGNMSTGVQRSRR